MAPFWTSMRPSDIFVGLCNRDVAAYYSKRLLQYSRQASTTVVQEAFLVMW